MRDHVAQACGVTKSKIARLHAIRENLAPELLVYYDDGLMVEDVAYQLSRFPVEIQEALSDKLADGKKRKMPIGSVVDAVLLNLEGLQKPMSCRAHAGGPDCHQLKERIVRSLLQPYSWAICDPGRCCMDCHRSREGCPGACREARDRANVEKAAEAERKAVRERDAELSQQILKNLIRDRAKVLLPYAEKAGLKDDQRISADYRSATVGDLRKWAAGEGMENAHFYGDECVKPSYAKDATEMSRRLGCSLELAMGLPEKPKAATAEPAAARGWETGTPKAAGWYATRTTLHGKPMHSPRCLWWNGSGWMLSAEDPYHIDKAMQVAGWIQLPKEGET
jgi:ParB family chromosome partitioning protein